jgi:hypothetical protein
VKRWHSVSIQQRSRPVSAEDGRLCGSGLAFSFWALCVLSFSQSRGAHIGGGVGKGTDWRSEKEVGGGVSLTDKHLCRPGFKLLSTSCGPHGPRSSQPARASTHARPISNSQPIFGPHGKPTAMRPSIGGPKCRPTSLSVWGGVARALPHGLYYTPYHGVRTCTTTQAGR